MVSLIVAMTRNRVLGRDGDMPWRLSADLKRFKKITMGHPLIMGRKTFDSIGRPLPGRTTIVVSRSGVIDDPNVAVARGFDEAVQIARDSAGGGSDDGEVFITGGAQIYELALPFVERIYLTQIHCTLEGDTFFPELDWGPWELLSQEDHRADERNNYDYSFLIYQRRKTNVR